MIKMLNAVSMACENLGPVMAAISKDRRIKSQRAKSEALAWAASRPHFRTAADNDNAQYETRNPDSLGE